MRAFIQQQGVCIPLIRQLEFISESKRGSEQENTKEQTNGRQTVTEVPVATSGGGSEGERRE